MGKLDFLAAIDVVIRERSFVRKDENQPRSTMVAEGLVKNTLLEFQDRHD